MIVPHKYEDVRCVLDLDHPPPLSKEQRAQVEKLAKMKDEDIDFSDIPPLTGAFWRNAKPRPKRTRETQEQKAERWNKRMPTIAIVDGVAIIIYPNDHIPPHVHARYAEFECKLSIVTGEVIRGELPANKLAVVRNWLQAHAHEVAFAWDEIHSGRGYRGRIE
jgi:hypothetical protein